MNKALVIRTFGDPDLCKQVADGWSQQVIPLDTEELDIVRAECEKLKEECKELKAKNSLMAFDNKKRFTAACEAQDLKYLPKQHGPVYWTLLRMWALIWLGIDNAYKYLSAWNRGEFDD